MAFMSFDRIGIRDSDHLLVLVGDEHGLFTGFDARFRAGRVFGVGALGAALGIADPAVPGHVFRRRQHSHALLNWPPIWWLHKFIPENRICAGKTTGTALSGGKTETGGLWQREKQFYRVLALLLGLSFSATDSASDGGSFGSDLGGGS